MRYSAVGVGVACHRNLTELTHHHGGSHQGEPRNHQVNGCGGCTVETLDIVGKDGETAIEISLRLGLGLTVRYSAVGVGVNSAIQYLFGVNRFLIVGVIIGESKRSKSLEGRGSFYPTLPHFTPI